MPVVDSPSSPAGAAVARCHDLLGLVYWDGLERELPSVPAELQSPGAHYWLGQERMSYTLEQAGRLPALSVDAPELFICSS